MRITDSAGNAITKVNLALSDDEARELRDALDDLLAAPAGGWHAHVSSSDYSREVTV